METQILSTAEAVAAQAARLLATEACQAVQERGRFLIATSGGTTPWRMLELLSREELPWSDVHWFQVDERVTDVTDSQRNLVHLRESLFDRVAIPGDQVHAMPVDDADLTGAAARYAATLEEIAGSPPALDVIHLGLGDDGHTASLVPGDPVLEVVDCTVAMTGLYRGHRRMTLTYPAFEAARKILWVVTGAEKREQLCRLRAGDHSIPAGRVRARNALILADAAASMPPSSEQVT